MSRTNGDHAGRLKDETGFRPGSVEVHLRELDRGQRWRFFVLLVKELARRKAVRKRFPDHCWRQTQEAEV